MAIDVRVCAVGLLLLLPLPAAAQQLQGVQARASVQDLKRLSIEELAELDVRTASRLVQRLSETPAAVSVVRGEDILRSGYVTLADSLRLAGGLDVARVTGNSWAISARGFNISSANKMLVLIDGRSVYSPLTGGTFWDAQDYLLDDVDRIEVVRGPGGASWGANAVNGVINVLTKNAAATRGTVALVSAGSPEHLLGAMRHGGRMGAAGSYRVYGRYRARGAELFADGARANNAIQAGQGGFRLDSSPFGAGRWTLQGDVYRGTQDFPDRPQGDTAGVNLMGRWTRTFPAGAVLQAQTYYDRTARNIPEQFRETRDTWDLDVELSRRAGTRHNLVGGGGVRLTHADDVGAASAGLAFEPRAKTDGLFSVFLQDEIVLLPARLYLTLGTKLERNDVTGVENQPTVRIRWSAPGRQTLWGAVSRAVRLPVRVDLDFRSLDVQTGALILAGSRDFRAEEVIAYEAGYRARPHARVSFDVATFANRYDRLRSTDVVFRPHPVIVLGNRLNAVTSGIEVAATAHPAEPWQLHGSYTYFHKELSFDGGPDFYGGIVEGNDPAHRFGLRSYLDLPRGFAVDAVLRHRSARPAPVTPPHTELNLRLGWAVRPGWEVSLAGQHLLERHNQEFFTRTQAFAFRRGAYLRSIWRF